MPLNPDMSLLHDWQTWRWNVTAWPRDDHFLAVLHVLTLNRIYLPPSSLSLLHWWAHFLLLMLFALHSFFSCCFYPFLLLLLSPSLSYFFLEETRSHSQLYPQLLPHSLYIVNNILTKIGFKYLRNIIISALALIVMLQLKWLHESGL